MASSQKARPKAPKKPPTLSAKELQDLLDKIVSVAPSALGPLGLELLSLEPALENGRRIIRVFIDHPVSSPPLATGANAALAFSETTPLGSRVTIDECVAVSRKLSETLDDPATELSAGYILEVSSPGLDHRLATEKEFRRFHGRLAKIKWPVDGKLMVLKGRLATADGPLRLITPTGEITFEANADLKAALIPEI